jgi:N-formylglutamate amidohydrolase
MRSWMQGRSREMWRLTGTIAGVAGVAGWVGPPEKQAEVPSKEAIAQPVAMHGAEETPLCRAHDLITVQRGTLPIILSAPHGGQARVEGSKDRTRGVLVRDDMTAEIAMLVAQRVTAKLGAKPSYVIAQFSRKDADANRAPESGEAYENDAAKSPYDAFHHALRTLVDEQRAERGDLGAILIDIHGQKREPEAIVRGTRDGKTVARLVARRGEEALSGPESICGRLRKMGYRVLPEEKSAADGDRRADARHPLDEKFFDGGYIVEHYGSMSPTGIDAIQIELGEMREKETLKVARDLGDAIAGFYETYLKHKDK